MKRRNSAKLILGYSNCTVWWPPPTMISARNLTPPLLPCLSVAHLTHTRTLYGANLDVWWHASQIKNCNKHAYTRFCMFTPSASQNVKLVANVMFPCIWERVWRTINQYRLVIFDGLRVSAGTYKSWKRRKLSLIRLLWWAAKLRAALDWNSFF